MVLFLRFIKYSMIMFAAMAVLGCVIIIPINNAGDNKNIADTDNPDFTSGLDKLSVANVEQDSSKLWTHVVFLYLFTAMALYLLHRLYKSSVELRAIYPRPEQETRSVMLTNLPSKYRSSQELFAYMSHLHGEDRVVAALTAPQAPKLRKLRERREKLFVKWAKAYDVDREKGVHTKTWTGPLPFTGKHAYAVEHYGAELEKLDAKINAELAQTHNATGCGFASFDTPHSALVAAQAIHEPNGEALARPGPDRNDVYWNFLAMPRWRRRLGSLWAAAWLFLLFVFWTVPVGFVAGLSNLENLAKIEAFDWLVTVVEANAFVRGIIQGLLASYALILFFALLPFIIRSILKPRGYELRSKLEVGVTTVYWTFLLLNVFLVYAIAGSLLSNIENLTSGAPDIVNLLATGIPAQATFFINYIVVQAFKTITLDQTFLIAFAVYMVKRAFLLKTPMQRQQALEPPYYRYHKYAASMMLVWGIALTFSILTPLILPFACAYFAVAYFWTRHNFIYTSTAKYQGLNLVPRMVTCLGINVIVWQLTLIGVLGLKTFPFVAFAVVPLVVTFGFVFGYLRRKFDRANRYIALSRCPQEAHSNRIDNMNLRKAGPDVQYYADPVLMPLKSTDDFKNDLANGRVPRFAPKDDNLAVTNQVAAQAIGAAP